MTQTNDVSSIVVFCVFGIILGTTVEIILKYLHLPIPYTVLIFYVGLILGIVFTKLDIEVSNYFEVSEVSSNLIVYGFLPVLLFSESLTLNRHHLYKCFNQAALLAGPGGVMVCMMLALCANQILQFNWSWNYCFLFGSILCATDPVSVVSLLKSTKASTKLTMIISGESLLNDGSAMIMYIFFYNMINGTVYTGGTFIAFCAEMLILSPLIGLVLGVITGKIMRRINRPTDSHLDFQLLFSFVCAYASFYIAGSLSKVSGVLACATAGVTVSFIAPLVVLEDHTFHVVWEYAEWICNTLIFTLAGFIGGSNTVSAITTSHILFLFIMYVVLLVTRGIMVFVMLPLLNRSGESSNYGEGLFMTYAGLRGALSIALALEGASNASDRGDEDFGKELFFMVTWLASLTLLLNGSTAGRVLLYFKLIDDPNAPPSPMLQQVLTRIKLFMTSLMKHEFNELKNELGDFNEKELMELCHLMSGNFRDSVISEKDEDEEEIKAQLSHRISGSMMIDKDLVAYTRTTFLDVVKARYYQSLHHGKIGTSSSASKLLLHAVDMAYDDVHSHLSDWEAIEETLIPNFVVLKTCQWADDFFYLFNIYSGLVSSHDAYYERIAIYVVTNFIDAHEYAQSRMSFFLGGPLLGVDYDIAQPEQMKVLMESEDMVRKAKELLKSFRKEDLKRLYTHRAAQALIVKQTEILHNIVHEGILSEKNAKTLFETLEEDKIRIRRREKDYDKDMVVSNIKEKVEEEKEIRSSMVQRPSILSKQEAAALAGSSSNSEDMMVTSPMRSTFRKNFTGDDNLNRITNKRTNTGTEMTQRGTITSMNDQV